ncbi:hypothetical protein [Thioclava sp. GXIMD2076]|uniref:hypothetical protein n=1 Tax=Thioclava sp. GXIMD2076 TaxID=3131931 RepID=UPI0030D12CCD
MPKPLLDTSGFTTALDTLAKRDVVIASTWALNDTAEEARAHVAERMTVVFDRPTRFTQNAFRVRKARSSDLEAAVEERATIGRRHYLKVQEEGGPRGQTGFEKLLSQNLAFEGIIQSVIPAEGARLDAYGNWSTGERNQVLSALNAQRDRAANATKASRKRKPKRARYFVPKAGLTQDIYKRGPSGIAERVAILSDKVPVYQKRLGFFAEAERIYETRLPAHLGRTLAKMIAKRFG